MKASRGRQTVSTSLFQRELQLEKRKRLVLDSRSTNSTLSSAKKTGRSRKKLASEPRPKASSKASNPKGSTSRVKRTARRFLDDDDDVISDQEIDDKNSGASSEWEESEEDFVESDSLSES